MLNKTNAGLIAAVAGKEFATWPGRPLEVWKEPVAFQGKIVSGVKVGALPASMPAGTSLAIPMPAPAAASGNGAAAPTADGRTVPFPGGMPTAAHNNLDDEIPF